MPHPLGLPLHRAEKGRGLFREMQKVYAAILRKSCEMKKQDGKRKSGFSLTAGIGRTELVLK
jgi:hypothetical protein